MIYFCLTVKGQSPAKAYQGISVTEKLKYIELIMLAGTKPEVVTVIAPLCSLRNNELLNSFLLIHLYRY